MISGLGAWVLVLLANVIPMEEKRFDWVFEQQADTTCGIASVSSFASIYWGRDVTEEELMSLFLDSASGWSGTRQDVSLYDLQLLLEHLGFTAGGFSLHYPALIEASGIYGPLICHLREGEGHFVLFLGEAGGFAVLGDPARGCIAMSTEEFATNWSGAALAAFHPEQSMRAGIVDAVLEGAGERLSALCSWCLR